MHKDFRIDSYAENEEYRITHLPTGIIVRGSTKDRNELETIAALLISCIPEGIFIATQHGAIRIKA